MCGQVLPNQRDTLARVLAIPSAPPLHPCNSSHNPWYLTRLSTTSCALLFPCFAEAVNLLGEPATTKPLQQAAAAFSTMLPAERWSAHVLSAARQPHLGLSLRKSGSFMDLLELSMSQDKVGGSSAAATTGMFRAQRKKRRRGGLGVSPRSNSRGGGPTQSTSGSCGGDTRRTVSDVHPPTRAHKVWSYGQWTPMPLTSRLITLTHTALSYAVCLYDASLDTTHNSASGVT